MKCAGCSRELQIGDRYIVDSASGFLKAEGEDATPEIDGLIAGIFGSSDGKTRFCEDCTEPGGDYLFETVYPDPMEDALDRMFGEIDPEVTE